MRKFLSNDVYFLRKYESKSSTEGEREGACRKFLEREGGMNNCLREWGSELTGKRCRHSSKCYMPI